jgi:hypothetical protein
MLGPRLPLMNFLVVCITYSTELEGDVRQMDRKWRRNSLESLEPDSGMAPVPPLR